MAKHKTTDGNPILTWEQFENYCAQTKIPLYVENGKVNAALRLCCRRAVRWTQTEGATVQQWLVFYREHSVHTISKVQSLTRRISEVA